MFRFIHLSRQIYLTRTSHESSVPIRLFSVTLTIPESNIDAFQFAYIHPLQFSANLLLQSKHQNHPMLITTLQWNWNASALNVLSRNQHVAVPTARAYWRSLLSQPALSGSDGVHRCASSSSWSRGFCASCTTPLLSSNTAHTVSPLPQT